MFIKDTEDSKKQPAWFAKADIAARAESAHKANPELFEHPNHLLLVARVEAVVKPHVVSYSKQYTECRPGTSKQPPHTRVKFDHVQFHKGGKKQVDAVLKALGIANDDIVYVPKTPAFYVNVK